MLLPLLLLYLLQSMQCLYPITILCYKYCSSSFVASNCFLYVLVLPINLVFPPSSFVLYFGILPVAYSIIFICDIFCISSIILAVYILCWFCSCCCCTCSCCYYLTRCILFLAFVVLTPLHILYLIQCGQSIYQYFFFLFHLYTVPRIHYIPSNVLLFWDDLTQSSGTLPWNINKQYSKVHLKKLASDEFKRSSVTVV